MKQLFKFSWIIPAAIALVACAKENHAVIEPNPNEGKEVIAFAGDSGALTNASLLTKTDDPYATETGFTSTTKIVMRIKADNAESSPTATRYSQAVATAAPRLTGTDLTSDWCYTDYNYTTPHSHVTYKTGQERYWDDAFGRSSWLTVYAVAVPDKNSTATTRTAGAAVISDDILNQASPTVIDANTNPYWYTIASAENTKITWTVSTQQTETTMADEDLLYSNNIRNGESTNWGRYHQSWGTPTADVWNKSKENGRLLWQSKDPGNASITVGKFDQGHLAFYHALTYLEINLTEGAGFDYVANTDFGWTNIPTGLNQTITLKKFPTSADLDLSVGMNGAGMWSSPSVNSIVKLKESTSYYSGTSGRTIRKLECLVIPGTTLDGENDNLIEFEIDNAKYYVSGEQIATAIQIYYNDASNAASVKTLAGKHYIINLTVGKTKVDNITAAVLPWETVNTANSDADNTHFSFTFEDRNTKLNNDQAGQFDIYRSARDAGAFIDNETSDGTPATTTVYDYEWKTGYTTGGVANKATKEYVSTDPAHWKTNWYWENNKTWYHFRAAGHGESASGDVTITKDETNGDHFPLNNGPIDGSADYKDWLWGAPFTYVNDTYLIKYTSANGFDNNANGGETKQIAPAIASTHDVIRMLLFHMTSQITVNLTTTIGDDKVVLHNGAIGTTVKIVRFLPEGIVRMGTGKVEALGTRDDGTGVTMTPGTYTAQTTPAPPTAPAAATYNGFTWGMVPQPLTYTVSSTTEHIGLEITTPDNNTYYVRDLSSITATLANISVANLQNPYTETSLGSGIYTVDSWYPHYKYTYNITLKKKGIDNITAAVLPWEVVEGENIDIDLEN